MDAKPVVTYYAKNTIIPEKLKDKIITNLPEECIEWQRSYGRSTKKVYLEVNLVPFKDASSLKENGSTPMEGAAVKHKLLGRCLLHTYWFECNDVDVYKSQIRDDVISWMNRLRENNMLDWLIVVVDSNEKKKSNKTKLLPRSTVADKVRSDFPSSVKDASDRCVTLVNPMKNETSAADSYEFFLDRLRLVLLKSYSKHLTRYEDHVRSQRERRNSKTWDFLTFFILQEEMAFAFEMLSLYEDALIQYDELDALFSQFVINSHHAIQPPDWLKVLIERCHAWSGLTLSKTMSTQLREKIRDQTASLLDLRNYLFSRQCELLLMQHKPWELSTRALPFLHNCVNELNILEISLPQGAVACWVFLSALEILQKCERYNDSSQMQIYSRYTIGLWAYARRKLEELGTLCGLMPGMNHDSECILKVVSLIAGMGNDPYLDEKLMNPSPQTVLKEALSKPEAFTKAYLEVSELTISTYKHIGRYRSGRLVGRELAFLYMKMDKHQQSIPFLLDLEKVFAEDRWKMLLTDTRKNILDCFLVLDDSRKILQYSLLLASSSILKTDDRVKYLNIAKEKLSSLINIKSTSSTTTITMEEILPVRCISIKSEGVFIADSTSPPLELSLTLESNLLETLSFASIRVNLSYEPFSPRSRTRSQDKHIAAKNSLLCPHPTTTLNSRKPIRARPRFETYHDTTSGYDVGIRCPNLNQVFKRLSVESTNGGCPSSTMDNAPSPSGMDHFFLSTDININPGVNELSLQFKPVNPGYYTIEGIKCFIGKNESLSFTHSPLPVHLCFTGIPKESNGLNGRNSDSSDANLGPSGTTTEHNNIILSYPDAKAQAIKPISRILNLNPPFISTIKLHSVSERKFIEIGVRAVSHARFELFDANLTANETDKDRNNDFILKSFNLPRKMALYKDQIVHYVWEIFSIDSNLLTKLLFSLKYNPIIDEQQISTNPLAYHSYDCDFSIKSIKPPTD